MDIFEPFGQADITKNPENECILIPTYQANTSNWQRVDKESGCLNKL